MSWQTQNALKRVFSVYKRFKEQKGKLWDNDIEALELLNKELMYKSESYVNDNILFAKLLCIAIKYRSEHFSDIKMALKSIDSDLNISLNEQIKLLQFSLNDIDKMNYLKSIGFDLDNQNSSKIEDLKGNEKEFLEKLKTNWTFENVYKSFMNSANDFLKDINNYN